MTRSSGALSRTAKRSVAAWDLLHGHGQRSDRWASAEPARERMRRPPKPGEEYTGPYVNLYRVSEDGRFAWGQHDRGHTARSCATAWGSARGHGRSPALELRGASSLYFPLFEETTDESPPTSSTGRYFVLDRELREVSHFVFPPSFYGPDPAFGPGGATAAVWSAPRDDRTRATLFLVDLASGSTRAIYDAAPATGGATIGVSTVALRGRGEIIETQVRYYPSQSGPPTKDPPPTTNLRFAWDGSALPTTGVDRWTLTSYAPAGNLTLREAYLRADPAPGSLISNPWPGVIVSRGGVDFLRVRSAWVNYGDGLGEERWLSDGSGFVAKVGGADPAVQRLVRAGVRHRPPRRLSEALHVAANHTAGGEVTRAGSRSNSHARAHAAPHRRRPRQLRPHRAVQPQDRTLVPGEGDGRRWPAAPLAVGGRSEGDGLRVATRGSRWRALARAAEAHVRAAAVRARAIGNPSRSGRLPQSAARPGVGERAPRLHRRWDNGDVYRAPTGGGGEPTVRFADDGCWLHVNTPAGEGWMNAAWLRWA